MATIHAFMIVHDRGCEGLVQDAECSSGCDWRAIAVKATFEPPEHMSLRDRVLLARMAAMFEARRQVNSGAR